jgi:hypothetical protein
MRGNAAERVLDIDGPLGEVSVARRAQGRRGLADLIGEHGLDVDEVAGKGGAHGGDKLRIGEHHQVCVENCSLLARPAVLQRDDLVARARQGFLEALPFASTASGGMECRGIAGAPSSTRQKTGNGDAPGGRKPFNGYHPSIIPEMTGLANRVESAYHGGMAEKRSKRKQALWGVSFG